MGMKGGIMTTVQTSQTSNPVRNAGKTLENGVRGAERAVDAVEETVERGISTRFPLNSAFILDRKSVV